MATEGDLRTLSPSEPNAQPNQSATELAQLLQQQASEFPWNDGRIKVTAQAAGLSASTISTLMTLIQDEKLNTPGLDYQIKETSDILAKLQIHVTSTQKKTRVMHQLGGDPELYSMMDELKRAVGTLETRWDIQVEKRLIDLRQRASISSERYSNADLATILKQPTERWKPTKPSVSISPECTTVNMRMEGACGDVKIRLNLNADFRGAYRNLAGYLSGYAFPNKTFPLATCKPGEIRLETDTKALTPVIFWVHYNVFVIAELEYLEHADESTHPRAESVKAFKALVERLFQSVREGCVETAEEVARPKIGEKQVSEVRVGDNFVVNVAVDRQCYHRVVCKDRVSRAHQLFSSPTPRMTMPGIF
ncbi:hypothetical protein F5Y14DRAFT_415887 [Nemania sp. NC0429]|nr:hypothetical protein F5Y14DRAFT_415887 [Nemania sp. NC0429]